jgi:hypothetical protein
MLTVGLAFYSNAVLADALTGKAAVHIVLSVK